MISKRLYNKILYVTEKTLIEEKIEENQNQIIDMYISQTPHPENMEDLITEIQNTEIIKDLIKEIVELSLKKEKITEELETECA